MAPGLSGNNTSTNLESTIAEIYKTLKRTENKTLETKRRASKMLEYSVSHPSRSSQVPRYDNSDRMSESFNYPLFAGNQDNHVISSPRYSTVGNRRTSHHREEHGLTTTVNEHIKTTPLNNSKLRTVIFRTLDRLFQIPNSNKQLPSKIASKEQICVDCNKDAPLSLETLKQLHENTTDTLSKNDCCIEKDCLLEVENEGRNVLECSYDESASDVSCWEFVAPLKFEDALVDDTLELTVSKTDKENDPTSSQNNIQKAQKIHYQRKSKRCKEKSRIQKRVLERQFDKTKSFPKKMEIPTRTNSIEKPKVTTRPDSPLLRKKSNEKCLQLLSLPNLVEAIQEIESSPTSTLSDCGTETFTRNISYCPSSTLSKSMPSFASNHENDDDACSTSSSFSSLQRMRTNDISNRSTHESTLPIPSALCKDVLVRPINVLIEPFTLDKNNAEVVGVTPENFKELTELYMPIATQGVTTKPNKPALRRSRVDAVIDSEDSKNVQKIFETGSLQTHVPPNDKTTQKFPPAANQVLVLNTSVPPAPPPMPPPPPPPSAQNTTLMRTILPLPIFTQRQGGNCIFNDLQDIRIDEGDAKKLKEKFPLKSGCKASKRLMRKDKALELTHEEKKFLHNIELFLRTCRISCEEIICNIVRSIVALNTTHTLVETEWFTGLAQSLPKVDELCKMKTNSNLQNSRNKTAAAKLVSQLLNITDLHGKLNCIQFSLDFEDGFSKVEKWTGSFVGACESITSSEKFVLIINVIMGLLQSLNTDEQSKIYGFDIQSLTRLATRTSEDGSSTLLHFVIEYILDRPALITSVDFYKSFNDFPDVTKTSIADMKGECKKWKQCLKEYRTQVEKIQSDNQASSSELEHATSFVKKTREKLNLLEDSLHMAQQSFTGCKEHFGLMNSETNEVIFFDSLSKFVTAYQKTYDEIIMQREKRDKQNTANINKRASMTFREQNRENLGATSSSIMSRGNVCADLLQSRVTYTEDSQIKKSPPKHNPRRKSFTPREFPDLVDAPETAEVGRSLQNLLTSNNSCNIKEKRVRKRASKSPLCKIPVIRR